MIFTGTFNNYDNSYTYSVTIGGTGVTTTIVDPLTIPSGAAAPDTIVMFDTDPVIITADRSDLTKRIIISQATINLVSNRNLTAELFANTNRSIPVTVTQGVSTCFFGYVDPLQFDEAYAHKYERIQINATDPLGALEDKNVGQISDLDANDVITSWDFLTRIISTIGITTIHDSVDATVKDAIQSTNVNMSIFFGESEDDRMTLYDALTEICKYWNLYVSYYNGCANISCTIVDDSQGLTITNFKDSAADDSTSLSVDTAYSQILVKADIEPVDDLVVSLDDDKYLSSDYNNYEKYMTEYICNDYWKFKDWITNSADATDGYTIEDFCWVKKNSLWDFGENGYTSLSYLDQRDYLTWLKNNSGKGAIIAFGQSSKHTPENNSPINNASLTNYLVISVNGTMDNTDAGGTSMQNMLRSTSPVCKYTGLSSAILSPSDDTITNYIVISGQILLNPLQGKTGPRISDSGKLLNSISDCLYWYNNYNTWPDFIVMQICQIPYGDKDGVYYQQGWERTPGIYGNLNNSKNQRFEYKYDRPGDTTDRISKLPILACELKVGDKYCVERLDQGMNGQGKFEWLTMEQCNSLGITAPVFTIGIDPAHSDKVVGQSFPIQNNTSYKVGIDKSGTAIPIKKSDRLAGEISFKILGPYNLSWTEVDSYTHGWWFWEKTHWTEDKYYVLQYIQSILVSNLKIETTSNLGMINANKNPEDKDLIYSSVPDPSYIDKLEEEIKICTPLTLEECVQTGVKYQISNSYIYNTDNEPFYGFEISEDEYIKPEACLVDYYYNEYCDPARTITTKLKANTITEGINGQMLNYTMMRMHIDNIYPGDSGAYRIMSYETSLKRKTVNATFREYKTQGQNQLS